MRREEQREGTKKGREERDEKELRMRQEDGTGWGRRMVWKQESHKQWKSMVEEGTELDIILW